MRLIKAGVTGTQDRHAGLDPASIFAFVEQVERTPCVYLLASGFHGTLYTGVSSNLVGRIHQHRQEVTQGFTSRYGVKRLVWFETGDTMESVIRREKQIKGWRRQWKIELIERDNPTWRDLAEDFGFEPLIRRQVGP